MAIDEKELRNKIFTDIKYKLDGYFENEVSISAKIALNMIIEQVEKDYEQDIYPLIRAIRQSDMGIAEISRKSKICRKTIYNLLNGEHPPKATTIIKLSRAVELDDDTILKMLQLDEE